MNINTMIPGNTGFLPAMDEIVLTAHAATVKGQVVGIDMTTATAANHGVPTHTKAVALADPLSPANWYASATEAAVIGQRIRYVLRGYVDGKADIGGIVAGQALTVNTSGELADLLVNLSASGPKVIAVAPENIAAGATGKVWFDGYGMGHYHV